MSISLHSRPAGLLKADGPRTTRPGEEAFIHTFLPIPISHTPAVLSESTTFPSPQQSFSISLQSTPGSIRSPMTFRLSRSLSDQLCSKSDYPHKASVHSFSLPEHGYLGTPFKITSLSPIAQFFYWSLSAGLPQLKPLQSPPLDQNLSQVILDSNRKHEHTNPLYIRTLHVN